MALGIALIVLLICPLLWSRLKYEWIAMKSVTLKVKIFVCPIVWFMTKWL